MKQELPLVKRTPCGYPAGPLRASGGTRYQVLANGQIVRVEVKPGKAELKRHKKLRRQERGRKARGQGSGIRDQGLGGITV